MVLASKLGPALLFLKCHYLGSDTMVDLQALMFFLELRNYTQNEALPHYKITPRIKRSPGIFSEQLF